MDKLLFFLLRKNAHRTPLHISTTELGGLLGMSQQNASRLLVLLEKEGKIMRKDSAITITPAGLAGIKTFFAELKDALDDGGNKLEFSGTIITGLGEGRYYVSKYASRIKNALGFAPFYGTLNIRLEKTDISKRAALLNLDPITIKGFSEKGRSFGDIFAYTCLVCGINGAIIIPLRTHHGTDVLEIISPKDLLKACNKKIGDTVRVTII